jgi:hypothetical protein
MSKQVVRVSKTINAPIRFVFNWCTDYREDDPQLTNSKNERRIILEKTKKRVVFATVYTTEDGNQRVGANFVTLKPPTSWHLEFFGQRYSETGEYELSRLGKDKTKLNMVFKEEIKTDKFPSADEIADMTSKDWDLFVEALEKEYHS